MAIKAKNIKRSDRERRKLRLRKRIRGTEEKPRLCVYRSSKHTYCQLISDVNGQTIASASSRDKEVASKLDKKSTKSVDAAKLVGELVAKRIMSKDIKSIVFDRNGFIYHGRVKALAEGAREGGLEF